MLLYYITLAWAGCVAYPCTGAMRRPELRDEHESKIPTSFSFFTNHLFWESICVRLKILRNMNFAKKIERFFARIRQRRKMSVLLKEKKQIEVIEKFNSYPESTESIGECSPIWVCWWQGEENMPAVVKTCYQSIQAHKGKHPVILITFKNQQEYVKFPDFIWEKHLVGLISNTHLSDLLRMYLLKEHGGIWVDITNFITRDIDRIVTVDQTFWLIGYFEW